MIDNRFYTETPELQSFQPLKWWASLPLHHRWRPSYVFQDLENAAFRAQVAAWARGDALPRWTKIYDRLRAVKNAASSIGTFLLVFALGYLFVIGLISIAVWFLQLVFPEYA